MLSGDINLRILAFLATKVHLELPQGAFPIPVSVKVTEGNKWDGHYLVELTESACKHLSDKGKNIKEVSADAGYDSVKTAKYLLQKNITPIIAENPRSRKNSKLQGRLQLLLRVNCFALQELNFVTGAESIKEAELNSVSGFLNKKVRDVFLKTSAIKQTMDLPFILRKTWILRML